MPIQIRSNQHLLELASQYETVLVVGFCPWNGCNHFLYDELDRAVNRFHHAGVGLAYFMASGEKDDELRYCPALAPFLHRFPWMMDPLFFVVANGQVSKVRCGNPTMTELIDWVRSDYLRRMLERFAQEKSPLTTCTDVPTPHWLFEEFRQRHRENPIAAQRSLHVLDEYAGTMDFHVMTFLYEFLRQLLQSRVDDETGYEEIRGMLAGSRLFGILFNLENEGTPHSEWPRIAQ